MVSARLRVGVLCGGASAERQISLATGAEIAAALPADRYEVVLLDPLALMAGNPALDRERRDLAARLLAGRAGESLPERDRALPAQIRATMERAAASLVPATAALGVTGGARIDVAFVALHGPWGEDGRIQGLLETLGIPHTGSGVLASALALDKSMAKVVLAAAGLAVPRGAEVSRAALASGAWRAAVAGIRFPAIVKPVRQGSSIGLSVVDAFSGLEAALAGALAHDDRALVEERVAGIEVTCGVIGNDEPETLPLVEIVPKGDVFDYRAKYDPSASDEICPARLTPAAAAAVRDAALRAHRALGCRGLSRVDLILVGDAPVVLEVNTMPGMTANSLLPKAALAAGIAFPDLLDRLVRWALEAR